ncbi:hypothetical protein KR222_001438, partial [Zaprionus bogoriensis]
TMSGDANERQFAFLSEQVQLCMLPALKQDLDEVQLLPAHFEGYHSLLQQELPKLYDVLQQNETVLMRDSDYQKLRAQLVLLLCELSATPTIYKLPEGAAHLLQNAKQLLEKLLAVCQAEEEAHIFQYYQQKLHKDCWKRQLGAVHAYVRYLEHFTKQHKMPLRTLTFSLAMGLNVRECYQPEYKQLGLRVFSSMLNHGHAADIQQLNIQSVIYENVFKDAYTMDTVEATNCIWNCLCLCLDHCIELDAYAWNQCDDMLERLIQNVTLASNAQLSICLLQFITKLGYYFTLNSEELRDALAGDISQTSQLKACCNLCLALHASSNYRWAKSILQMLVLESEKLLQSAEICAQLLAAMQRCYLVCILPIPLPALKPHLREFLTKFVAVLLQSLAAHKKATPIVKV